MNRVNGPKSPLLEGSASGAAALEFFDEWVLIEAELFHFEGRIADHVTTLEVVASPLSPFWNDVERWDTEIRLRFHEVRNFSWNARFTPHLKWDLFALREDRDSEFANTLCVDQKFTTRRGKPCAKLSIENSGFVRFDFESVDYLIKKIDFGE